MPPAEEHQGDQCCKLHYDLKPAVGEVHGYLVPLRHVLKYVRKTSIVFDIVFPHKKHF